MQVGDTKSWTRTFTEEDIRLFGQISGDQGEHHVTPDNQGRLMAHGLLTATLPTKLGGDLNFIGRKMTFNFLRPVFAGDTIRCDIRVEHIEPFERGQQLYTSFSCRNQYGKEVLTGTAEGVILNILL